MARRFIARGCECMVKDGVTGALCSAYSPGVCYYRLFSAGRFFLYVQYGELGLSGLQPLLLDYLDLSGVNHHLVSAAPESGALKVLQSSRPAGLRIFPALNPPYCRAEHLAGGGSIFKDFCELCLLIIWPINEIPLYCLSSSVQTAVV
ncbi:hypothetical protein HZ326_2866 [Fusarium oxysporum f. sp. albedinis]|nr:hypothetical protein HZ326_2866 [Fusarium oxysporum f. sp. albedinis]